MKVFVILLIVLIAFFEFSQAQFGGMIPSISRGMGYGQLGNNGNGRGQLGNGQLGNNGNGRGQLGNGQLGNNGNGRGQFGNGQLGNGYGRGGFNNGGFGTSMEYGK